VTIGRDGRLVITSQDTAALDLMEELLAQLVPPRKDYEVFSLQHADAYWVMKNLEDFFEEEEEEPRSRSRYFYFYDPPPPRQNDTRNRLSQRRKLKFIYDLDTNSILVQGADPQQLKTIAELIEIYDRAEPADSSSARMSAVYQVRYSRASVIAETVKDVYRDLLSSNDKALAQNPEQRGRAPQTTYIFSEGDSGPERSQFSFKGKLSIGVDDLTNTLIVSAEGEHLLNNVGEMIQTLDEAAKPLSTVSVKSIDGGVNAERVRSVLSAVLAEAATAPPSGPGPQNGARKPGEPPGRPGPGYSRAMRD
jgi:hypothetical protein